MRLGFSVDIFNYRPQAKKAMAVLPLIVLFWLGLFFCPFFSHRVMAADNSSETTVRVGYFYNGDFMHKNNDGAYEGYDIEYYYTIAGYADWKIQIVEFDSLNSATAAMEKGDIDIMSGLSKTTERESKFLVSSQKMCTAHIAVQTRADDDRFAAGDTSTMKDLTCGILKGSNVVTLYTNWCADNGLTPHIVEYDSLDARNAGLASGEVDAIAGGSTIEGAQKIAEFPSLDLFFMFNKDKGELKSQLDRAMGILSLENPTYAQNLFEKYFPSSRNTKPSFSSGEKEYIKNHSSIKVALLENDGPFSNKALDGSVKGILPEYYDHLSKVIGTTFTCVPYASKAAACEAMAAGKVDMVGKTEDDIYDANSRGIILTNSYLSMNMVQITQAGTGKVETAAVPECNADSVAQTLKDMGSSIKTKTYKNSENSFDALKSGAVDAVICTQPAATWLLNRNRSSDYVIASFGSSTWNISAALPYGTDGNTLRSILNKTITVDGGYINQLIASDTLEDSADLASVFDRLPVSMVATVAIVAGLLLAVSVAALIIIIRRRDTEKKLALQQAELTAAMEANKARHAFFGAVSHDMRTPLNGIVGFTDLAMASDDPAEVKNYLDKIRASGSVLQGLVNDTLIMSRIENGKYVLNLAPNDVTGVIEEILEPIRETARERKIHFVEEVTQTHRVVMIDRLSLQKILLNLLTNAMKFTPEGGTVRLGCHLDPPDGESPDTVITISDTGPGIAPESLNRVFEPFFQENPSNADASGSGMGLSIVKSIVDAMEGTIAVESGKGLGTTFTVRLHLSGASRDALTEDAQAPPDTGVLEGRRVLICEDSSLNLEILKTILKRQGMEVDGASNGKLGVSAFKDSPPDHYDAILLDLRMPVMDGKTAARAIRDLEREDARKVPIIAVSADAYPEDIQACLDAGMDGHIAKPVDVDELLTTLIRFIGQGRPDHPAE